MAPNSSASADVSYKTDEEVVVQEVTQQEEKTHKKHKIQIVWRNVVFFSYLHLSAVYGIYLMVTTAKTATSLWGFFISTIAVVGTTAGVHRLWSHRSYKAKWPLRFLLLTLSTMTFQDAVVDWARNHRVHHKYAETDADPHNAKRGFFFSHIGWLLCRKHPEVIKKGKGIDLSDLYEDPMLRFQKKYYYYLMPITCFLLPTVIPMYFWNESFSNAFFINLLRYTYGLNITWLINSVAHAFGNRPYDRFVRSSEHLGLAILTLGESWHNYHHTFPWDYKTSELGKYSTNFTTAFIDLMAKIGWAYDLKTVSEKTIKKRVQRTGDGSHELWGWGDKDQTQEEKDEAQVIHKKTG